MSIRVMTWVWDHSRSKKMDRLVLLAIADCASDDGRNAYPSKAELMRKTGLSERGLQGCVGNLVRLGELKVYRNAGPGGCNRFRVVMKTPAESAPPAESAGAGAAGPPRNSCGTPPQELRDPPAGTAPVTVLEPSVEPSVEPSTPPRAADGVIDAEIVDGTPNLPATAEPENAGHITKAWIDHCAGRGVKLTGSIIKRYAKGIGDARQQGFPPNLIKTALAQMLDDNEASRPSLLDNYLVRAQTGPAKGPRRMTPGEAAASRHAPAGADVGALIHDALTRPA